MFIVRPDCYDNVQCTAYVQYIPKKLHMYMLTNRLKGRLFLYNGCFKVQFLRKGPRHNITVHNNVYVSHGEVNIHVCICTRLSLAIAVGL